MKKMLFAAFAAVSIVAVAAELPKSQNNLTPEQLAKQAELKRQMYERSGGMVEKFGEGAVAVINCQGKIAADEVFANANKLHRLFRIRVNTSKRDAWKITDGVPNGVQAAIYIVDDASLPMSLVAAESHWGVVNVATLDAGKRFSKQFTRVVTMTLGASLAMTRTSPMQPVSTSSDLDKLLTDGYTMESVNAMVLNMKAMGITQGMKASYRRACMEGWAAAPTNEVQKAIWDKVRQLPSDPIKIKYDPKRDK